MWLMVGMAVPSLIWHRRDVLICFAREICISSAFVLWNLCNLARVGAVFLFFVIVAVDINFNPFDSNLIWLSVKFALDRFFINLSLFFSVKEKRSIVFCVHWAFWFLFVFLWFWLVIYFTENAHTQKNNFSSQIGPKTFSMFYNNGI